MTYPQQLRQSGEAIQGHVINVNQLQGESEVFSMSGIGTRSRKFCTAESGVVLNRHANLGNPIVQKKP